MGQFADSGTRAEGTFTRQFSQDLAAAYADYVNALRIVDEKGNVLELADSGEGVVCAGSYYDYVKAQIERSLNNFLADTEFPYTPSNSFNAYEGAGTSKPSVHWRIRTGITQGDTANATEINLALALAASDQVEDVDFETVWGQGHTMAERTGSSTENFIAWVNDCCN